MVYIFSANTVKQRAPTAARLRVRPARGSECARSAETDPARALRTVQRASGNGKLGVIRGSQISTVLKVMYDLVYTPAGRGQRGCAGRGTRQVRVRYTVKCRYVSVLVV